LAQNRRGPIADGPKACRRASSVRHSPVDWKRSRASWRKVLELGSRSVQLTRLSKSGT